MPWIVLHNICRLLPFLRLRSRQSLMVMRLSIRKSYSCLEEKACRSDSRPASRVFVLWWTKEKCNRQTVPKKCRPVLASSQETHLLSIRLSMHCLSLSSMSSCSVCSSTSLAPVLADRQQAKLSTDWASTSVQEPPVSRRGVHTCILLHRRGALAGAAVVAENFRCRLVVAGVRLFLKPIFNSRWGEEKSKGWARGEGEKHVTLMF